MHLRSDNSDQTEDVLVHINVDYNTYTINYFDADETENLTEDYEEIGQLLWTDVPSEAVDYINDKDEIVNDLIK